jgi:hypothetical protein
VVLVLEDAHRADQSSLDLLHSLARLVPGDRVFLLVALRPSEPRTEELVQSVVPRLGAHAVVVDVEPLGQAEAEHLVANLVRNSALPRSVLVPRSERTGGNPFFIEEIVRSWVDDELVVPSGHGFRVSDGLENVAIPYTVNQAVMARIDRLDDDTRDLLRCAWVIGRSFFYRVLERLVGETGSVGPIVARLTEMQLLLEGRRMEEVELLFKHALVQQAISYVVAALAMAGATGLAKRLLSSQAIPWETVPDDDGTVVATCLYMDLVDANRDTRSPEKATLSVNWILVYCGLAAIERADFDEARRRTEQLESIADELQSRSGLACRFELNA